MRESLLKAVAFALLVLLAVPVSAAEQVALVIGNGAYADCPKEIHTEAMFCGAVPGSLNLQACVQPTVTEKCRGVAMASRVSVLPYLYKYMIFMIYVYRLDEVGI